VRRKNLERAPGMSLKKEKMNPSTLQHQNVSSHPNPPHAGVICLPSRFSQSLQATLERRT
jgi:hypothetical protein